MKTCIFASGRFNPPHKGHFEMINRVRQEIELHHASHLIGVGNAYDKNNPIEPAKKLSYLRTLFPEINFVLLDNYNPSFFDLIYSLYKQGVEHLIIVVGSDRAKYFKDATQSLNNQNNLFHFKKITIIADNRETNAKGEFAISSTQLRKFAFENDFQKFFSLMSPEINKVLAKEIFNNIKRDW